VSKMKPCSGGDCIRILPLPCGAKILYSNRRIDLPILADADEWAKFVAEIKAGVYDEPEPAPSGRRNPSMSAAEMRERVAAEEGR
jgi:hypothetical protein